MVVNVEGWLERAASFGGRVGTLAAGQKSGEALTFAISMGTAFYGANSPQVEAIRRRVESISKEKGATYPEIAVYEFALGCIHSMAAEIKGGWFKARLGIVGEVLADLVAMAKDALNEKSVQVAAVLTAAAFEDLMRSLGRKRQASRAASSSIKCLSS